MRTLCLALALLGCHAVQPPEETDVPTAPDDWRHVRDDFRGIVELAAKGDEGAIRERLKTYLLTEEEVLRLFGPERGPRVWKGYDEVIAADLLKEAPSQLVARVKEGHSVVDVDRLGSDKPQYTTPGDQRMIAAMVEKHTVYNLRLRKPDDPLGLRLDGFLYLDGKWRFLFKAYNHLDPPAEG